MRDDLEMAWVIIANAAGGNWDRETDDWHAAAVRWRDKVLPGLSVSATARALVPSGAPTTETSDHG